MSKPEKDWRDWVVGAYYGCEISVLHYGAIQPENYYWWNGSGWVKGRLPKRLWKNAKTCRRRYRSKRPTETNGERA